MDIVVNGPKIWDVGFDLVGAVDTAAQISRQCEAQAHVLRINRRELDLVFRCSCHCIAYVYLCTGRDAAVVTQALIEERAHAYASLCRTHHHCVLDILDAQRARQGLAPLDAARANLIECREVRGEGGRFATKHSHARCHHQCYLAVPDDLQQADALYAPSVCADDFAAVVHVADNGQTQEFFAMQFWNALAALLPCHHCRPHLAIMVRHWLKEWMLERTAAAAATTPDDGEDSAQRAGRQYLDKIRVAVDAQSEAFGLMATRLSKLEQRLADVRRAGAEDEAQLYKGTPEVNAGYFLPYLTSRLARIKNAVNERKMTTKDRQASRPDYHWALVRRRALNFGRLCEPLNVWHVVISLSLTMHDDVRHDDQSMDDLPTAHFLQKQREAWLEHTRKKKAAMPRLSAAEREQKPWLATLSAFDQAMEDEAADDGRWRLWEVLGARRRAFVSLLEALAVLCACSADPATANMPLYLYPIPPETIVSRKARTEWLIGSRWQWARANGVDTMKLVADTYVGAAVAPFSELTMPMLHALTHYTEWKTHGYSVERYELYVHDTLETYKVMDRDLVD